MKHKELRSAVRLLLTRARRRISKPQRWTRGYFARTSRGRQVDADHSKACRWCASGAVTIEAAQLTPKELFATTGFEIIDNREQVQSTAIRLLSIAARKIGPRDINIVALNDDGPGGHRDVIRAFKEVIYQ